jgi:hypothetical protein
LSKAASKAAEMVVLKAELLVAMKDPELAEMLAD